MWSSPAYVKRLVGDKLDSRSSLCRFIGYPKETAGYYFYDPAEQKIFVSKNAVFLEKGFPSDSCMMVLIEESNEEPHRDTTTSFDPTVHTDSVPVLRRSTRESRVPDRYGFVGLTSQLDNDPKTYEEAMSDIDSDKWLEAIKSEMDSMGSNQIWTLVDSPKGARPVGCKWVYKLKLGANGEVTAFKARLVAKGYTQRPGVDFEETYSPVAMAKSIRILLATAAWYDYEIWQMDVKTAFLNGFVEEEIFMDQLEGFTAVGEEQKVCYLQRSIYGLKQASRSWNTRFDEVIRGYDFIKNDYDPCDIKAWLSTQFSMKDMGEASYILGIKIYRDRSRRMLGLTQSSYIEKVLKRFKMEHSERGLLPMKHGIKLSKKQSPKTDEELKRMSNIPYASVVGSYSDASFQSDDEDAKSQSDFVFKLNGGVVAWKSSKQDTTLNSTTEAEYIAASEAAKEAVWMKNYIQELGVVPSIAEPVVIFCDNNGAIAHAKESRSHHRSKQILRRYHLLREMVSRGNCKMDRVSSAENTADPLTKPISQIAHIQHLDKMDLRSMGDWL
ncbi:UNVERIFIED_CONTAM: Copia protein [Sesamum radiatum]|uniref:Copia protein n=1 Tax=Sesamum radiatum TaxID=300843 RepID=A0AAW2TXG7_SESRA